tara:strand:- start:134 stop:721 length:588 start_codon:yes stop_codon:yes gene_type:complete
MSHNNDYICKKYMREEMKKKEFNYTLIILNKGIEGEVVEIAEDISIVCNTEEVNYFFNESHYIYTFKTKESFSMIKEWAEMVLTDFGDGYILLPYDVENSLINLPNNVKTHLFSKNTDEINESELINHLNTKLKQDFDFLYQEIVDKEDDDDEIVKIRNRKSKKTLNQILDKIFDKGIDSIGDDEKQILKEISNK